MIENESVFFVGGVGGPRTPEGGLTGKGGVVRVGMGWERWERGVLEKERVVVGFGGDGSVGVVRADRELEKERVVVGAVRAVGTVGGDENKRGCPKSFS